MAPQCYRLALALNDVGNIKWSYLMRVSVGVASRTDTWWRARRFSRAKQNAPDSIWVLGRLL